MTQQQKHLEDLAPMIELRRLVYTFPGGEGPVEVLKEVNLSVTTGQFVAVLGASGSGKSTLINLIGGLERCASGQIQVNGLDVGKMKATELETYRQQQVGFVFQFFNLLPTLTALENVMLALEALNSPPKDIRARALQTLDEVGLAGKAKRYPSQLSGGEQQRVAIARALVREAPLILADEPTGNLDEDTAGQVMELFADMQRRVKTTLLLITHDATVAARADRILRLSHGQLHEQVRGLSA
ncbi:MULTISPECIES: ABC transporter ATP-binding protein [unclassified Pseudomonas]|uniref:ABC transporter ATP-binding protein n=1 Tax=unclassified Pseudomonas TaxID=196821 RepID=UPI000BA3F7A4|nr:MULTISPECIES: ABC transporter ATP-binding protein [unclassified Pseudomonas]